MSEHTPGPWHMGSGNGEGSIFADRDGRMRLEIGGTTLYPICMMGTGWEKDEDQANARLIAAAPDLLDACRRALTELRDITFDWDNYESASIPILERVIREAEVGS